MLCRSQGSALSNGSPKQSWPTSPQRKLTSPQCKLTSPQWKLTPPQCKAASPLRKPTSLRVKLALCQGKPVLPSRRSALRKSGTNVTRYKPAYQFRQQVPVNVNISRIWGRAKRLPLSGCRGKVLVILHIPLRPPTREPLAGIFPVIMMKTGRVGRFELRRGVSGVQRLGRVLASSLLSAPRP